MNAFLPRRAMVRHLLAAGLTLAASTAFSQGAVKIGCVLPLSGGSAAVGNQTRAGVIAVYASLFGLGQLVLGTLTNGFIFLAVAAVCFAWIARSLRASAEPLPATPSPRS